MFLSLFVNVCYHGTSEFSNQPKHVHLFLSLFTVCSECVSRWCQQNTCTAAVSVIRETNLAPSAPINLSFPVFLSLFVLGFLNVSVFVFVTIWLYSYCLDFCICNCSVLAEDN